jgi:glucokinase
MKGSSHIGVDIGGTHLRAALVDEEGGIDRHPVVKTAEQNDKRPEALLEKLVAACRALIRTAERAGRRVDAVGLSVAGKIDRTAGSVLFSPNIPWLNGYPLAGKLQETLDVSVAMDNDANAFAVGEAWKGAARGIPNWVGVTLGTGVGGALFLGGRLWTGDNLGFEGEIGHMIVDPAGPPCVCGLRGCLEAHASGSALCRGAREAIEAGRLTGGALFDLARSGGLTAEAVFHSAQSGDAAALALFERMGWALGLALASLFTVLGIRHAVIGGGVSAAWDRFIGPLHASLKKHSSMLDPETAEILHAKLGDDAALLGAARLAGLGSGTGERS